MSYGLDDLFAQLTCIGTLTQHLKGAIEDRKNLFTTDQQDKGISLSLLFLFLFYSTTSHLSHPLTSPSFLSPSFLSPSSLPPSHILSPSFLSPTSLPPSHILSLTLSSYFLSAVFVEFFAFFNRVLTGLLARLDVIHEPPIQFREVLMTCSHTALELLEDCIVNFSSLFPGNTPEFALAEIVSTFEMMTRLQHKLRDIAERCSL